MSVDALAHHLERPLRRGHVPASACTGAAGGAACGDLIRVSLAVDPTSAEGRIVDAGFDASGCGAAIAAGSATVALVRGERLLSAARLGANDIAAELGGLGPAKRHAAELAADALHRALGWAAREHAQLAMVPSRTLVAMSGGVDSAVAALLVCQGRDGIARGGDVGGRAHPVAASGRDCGEERGVAESEPSVPVEAVAVTLELWADPENDGERSCCSAQAVRAARDIAHGMGLAHFSIDLREEFRAGVVDGWLADHAAGLTPNPCVRCNGNVRLDAMLDLAERLGASALATGHYARVVRESEPGACASDPTSGRDRPLLRVARDESKDQSYALAALAPESLARLRFPLGALTKPEVRELAARAGLAVARRPDSQDLCFLAGTKRVDFLERHGGLGRQAGPILDSDGRTLGEHGGVHTVTIGQRHGLGLGGGPPRYVIATDVRAGTVTVGSREQLLAGSVRVRDVVLHREGARVDGVKVRYRGQRMPCRVEGSPSPGTHERLEVRMAERIERTAPGQVACLYAGDTIVGHGTIASSVSSQTLAGL
ncbi:MAG TPA: iron-sulfur cluster assembly scaffold protein [Solirubrobacteraceae bacterium]|nr:iron-sulfur cluster assembly scaffold protein [Solirubrobacteraceae bacterium]